MSLYSVCISRVMGCPISSQRNALAKNPYQVWLWQRRQINSLPSSFPSPACSCNTYNISTIKNVIVFDQWKPCSCVLFAQISNYFCRSKSCKKDITQVRLCQVKWSQNQYLLECSNVIWRNEMDLRDREKWKPTKSRTQPSAMHCGNWHPTKQIGSYNCY